MTFTDRIELAEDRREVSREALECLRRALRRGELGHATATQARYILGCAGSLGMLEDEKPAAVAG